MVSQLQASSVGFAPGAFRPETGPEAAGVVLLIEDDETIAKLVTVLLRRLHLRTRWCELGARALEEFRREAPAVVLVIADCGLPDMDGREVCRQLAELAPGLPMLITSGGPSAAGAGLLKSEPWRQYLRKPYAPGDFIGQVRALLARV